MELQFWPAILGGLLGGTVMSIMTAIARKKGLTGMSITVIEGGLFTGDGDKARKIGLFTHVVVMSALAIGSIYGLLFAWFDVAPEDAWWVGALFGLVHGAMSGFVIGALPKVHPRVGGQGVTPAEAGRDFHLATPGLFAHNYGSKTPPMLMMGHLLYGLVVGTTVSLLAT